MANTKLDNTIAAIEKEFGKGSIMFLGESKIEKKMDTISTGVLSLDMALGVGGLPKGRIVEVFGPESGGKTTLALQIIAMAQKAGGRAAFIDAEHAFDPKYAKAIGVDVKHLAVSQPDSGEQGLTITERLVQSGEFDICVIDSVSALVPQAELDGDMGASHMGLQARLMSQALRKLTGMVSKTKTILIFINQLRMKIGVVFGNPETTTGGNALKFYASIRLDIRRKGVIKKGEAVIGNIAKVKVVKNKVAAPFKEVEFNIIFGKGADREDDILNLAVARGIVDKKGTWYTYGDERIGQGQAAAADFLRSAPEMAEKIVAAIWAYDGEEPEAVVKTGSETFTEQEETPVAAEPAYPPPPSNGLTLQREAKGEG